MGNTINMKYELTGKCHTITITGDFEIKFEIPNLDVLHYRNEDEIAQIQNLIGILEILVRFFNEKDIDLIKIPEDQHNIIRSEFNEYYNNIVEELNSLIDGTKVNLVRTIKLPKNIKDIIFKPKVRVLFK